MRHRRGGAACWGEGGLVGGTQPGHPPQGRPHTRARLYARLSTDGAGSPQQGRPLTGACLRAGAPTGGAGDPQQGCPHTRARLHAGAPTDGAGDRPDRLDAPQGRPHARARLRARTPTDGGWGIPRKPARRRVHACMPERPWAGWGVPRTAAELLHPFALLLHAIVWAQTIASVRVVIACNSLGPNFSEQP